MPIGGSTGIMSPRKHYGNFDGGMPDLDISDGVLVGDMVIDEDTSPASLWQCVDNTEGASLFILLGAGGGKMDNPMTAEGDMIIGGEEGAPVAVPKGENGQIWKLVGSSPQWSAAGISGNFDGGMPDLDISDGVLVGDMVIDTDTSPASLWQCTDNTEGASLFILLGAGGGGVRFEWLKITNNTAAEAYKGYMINPAEATTLTLPENPAVGDPVGWKALSMDNPITLGRNGSRIEGQEADMVVDIEGAGGTLVYSGAEKGWVVVTEIAGA
jgi:hypothetical protein